MARVVITDHNFFDHEPELSCAKANGAEFELFQCRTEGEVIRALAGADLAFVQMAPVPPEAVAGMNKGSVIIRYGVGVDNLPLAACAKHGVRVCNVPDYGMSEVADHAVAMLLALHRRLPQLDAQVRGGGWDSLALCSDVSGLSEVTLGVLGAGRIGKSLIKRMRAFDIHCLAHDPALDDAAIKDSGAEPVDLEQLLRRSDLLSIHAPAVAATSRIINSKSIAKMRDGVIIVNCSRGELVNEEDLAEALRSGKVAGAGLDVFASEPLDPESPLRDAPNVLLSPHAAWASAHSTPRLQRLAAEEGMRALRNEPLRCEIDLSMN